uniref:Cytochrome c oxidase subunit 2 n=1 Tax=Trichobilharzia regenti TaxID=157069 RepID=A7J1L5_TRIRE|nr:cytochrome c oxidase subunit II [Trichobilharzia regenti]ABG91504.1 cytochrome c oxidase subunit II [Trichobilharzia regenti]BAV82963.1 cytochrome c oxidase subunit II [Trichobilharzia regenti]
MMGVLIYYDLVVYIIGLCIFIPCWCMIIMYYQVYMYNGVVCLPNEEAVLELLWTLIPSILVLVLCFFNLHFLLYENSFVGTFPIKVVGHQWYWTYELPSGCIYDSYMTDFVGGVNKPLRLTFNLPYSFLITSADVIHSFSVPDLGIKLDGVPGRINCLMSMIDRLGVYVGYCTELCGAGHGYMPIVVEVVYSDSQLC